MKNEAFASMGSSGAPTIGILYMDEGRRGLTHPFFNPILNAIRDGHKILDIAGKAGEFALAAYERMKALGCEETAIRESICTIPTSGITYEFTRMVYEILGLDVDCLANNLG